MSNMHHNQPNQKHAPQRNAGQPAQAPQRPAKMAGDSEAADRTGKPAPRTPERDRH